MADVLPDAPPTVGRREPVPCRLCGQPLTSSASRRWGIGEDCRRKLRLREAPAPPENPADQDALPGL